MGFCGVPMTAVFESWSERDIQKFMGKQSYIESIIANTHLMVPPPPPPPPTHTHKKEKKGKNIFCLDLSNFIYLFFLVELNYFCK